MAGILDELVLVLDLDSKDFRAGELAVVAGIDRLTELMEQAAAKFDDGGKKTSQSLDKTAKKATQTGKEMEAAGKKAASFFSDIRTQVLALAGVSLSLAGIKNFVTGFTGKLNELTIQADAFGMSAKSLDGWTKAGQAFGVSSNEIVGAFSRINDAKAKLRSGKGLDPSLQMLMQAAGQAGINIDIGQDSTESLIRKQAEIFPRLTKDQQQTYGSSLGWGYAGQQWLSSGHATRDVDLFTSRSGVTDEAIAAVRRFRAEWAGLEQSFEKTGYILFSSLLPYIERFNNWLSGIANWMASHPDEMKAKVDSFLSVVGNIAGVADDAAQAVGGWKNAILLLVGVGVGGKLLGFLSLFTNKIGGLSGAIALAMAASAWNKFDEAEENAHRVGKSTGEYLVEETKRRAKEHASSGNTITDHILEWWSKATTGNAAVTLSPEQEATQRMLRNARFPLMNGNSAAQLPRGIRNNNPGNLNFAGQAGAVKEGGPNGRFAVFSSMSEGIAALYRQLQLYMKRGVNTVSGIVKKYAPAADGNNVAGYISALTRQLGVSADQKLDSGNLQQMISLMNGIITHENGKGYITPQQIAASLPRPGAQLSAQTYGGTSSNTVTQSTHIGTLNVTTNAKNVQGITDDAHRKISRSSLAMNYASGVSG